MTPHRPYLTVDNKSTSSKHQQAAGREEYVCPWCSYWQLLQNNTFEANKYIQITAEAKNKTKTFPLTCEHRSYSRMWYLLQYLIKKKKSTLSIGMVLRGGLPLTVCGGGGSITKKKSTPSIGMVLPFHWPSTNCLCTVCGGGGIITEKINQLFFFFFTVTETKAEAAFKAEKNAWIKRGCKRNIFS